MKELIPGYPDYYFIGDVLFFVTKKGKVKTINKGTAKNSTKYRIKNSDGMWCRVSEKTLLAAAGRTLKIPKDAKQIPNTSSYWIDESSNIYSFSAQNLQGIILKPIVSTDGYMHVSIVTSDNCTKNYSVHTLMVQTFIMEDYISKGLCCMHLDNNKHNNNLSNLAVGTYSENNKAAYRDGLNPGNGLKKI